MGCGNPFSGNQQQEPEDPSSCKVFCVKFQKEMAGLDEPPFNGELGDKIYNSVSKEAWKMWRALQDAAQ